MSTAAAVWVRMIPEHSQDAWLERLTWAGPENCVVTHLPGRKTAKLEVYGMKTRALARLQKEFGGSIVRKPARAWLSTQQHSFYLPLPPRLCLASEVKAIPLRHQKLPRLILPAGMAFGTGEHATTALCLRQMLRRLPAEPQQVLDAGTGSGILALAAALGGHKVVGVDFDPESIHTARGNAARNPQHRPVRWVCGDILRFKPAVKFDLITANLFSTLLVQTLPLFRKWMREGGVLILSGILRDQEKSVREASRSCGFKTIQRLRKGKWICLVLG